MTYLEIRLRRAAAMWASALLVKRPPETWEETEALDRALSECLGRETAVLVADLEALLGRDDEDTDETARLVFEALGKPTTQENCWSG